MPSEDPPKNLEVDDVIEDLNGYVTANAHPNVAFQARHSEMPERVDEDQPYAEVGLNFTRQNFGVHEYCNVSSEACR